MIQRLALFLGGAGAAGVLALAMALGGSNAAPPNTADAFVPVANDVSAADQPNNVPAATAQPTPDTSNTGSGKTDKPKKVVDTVYVQPHKPVVHRGGANNPQPTNKPTQPSNNNGGNQTHHGGGDGSSGGDESGGD